MAWGRALLENPRAINEAPESRIGWQRASRPSPHCLIPSARPVQPLRIQISHMAQFGLAGMTGAGTVDYESVLPYNGDWTSVSESICERGEIPQGLHSEGPERRGSLVRMQRCGPGEVGLGLFETEGPGAGELARGLPEVLRGDAQGDQIPLIPEGFFLRSIVAGCA